MVRREEVDMVDSMLIFLRKFDFVFPHRDLYLCQEILGTEPVS